MQNSNESRSPTPNELSDSNSVQNLITNIDEQNAEAARESKVILTLRKERQRVASDSATVDHSTRELNQPTSNKCCCGIL